jgi:flagellar biosynthesis protein FlhB
MNNTTVDQISIFDSSNLPGEEMIKKIFGDVSMFDVLKWMLVVGLGMYILFAFVIIKQVEVMTETVEDDSNGVIKIFAWAHLVMAIGVVVLCVMWL